MKNKIHPLLHLTMLCLLGGLFAHLGGCLSAHAQGTSAPAPSAAQFEAGLADGTIITGKPAPMPDGNTYLVFSNDSGGITISKITPVAPGAAAPVALGQAGTLAGFFGTGSTNSTLTSLYKGTGDLLAYVQGNTNGYARVTLEGYYLITKNQGNGGGLNFYIPVSGTNNILGVGFGAAYLNHTFYDATLNARLGDAIPLPLGLQKFFPLYAYVESGGGYNFSSKQGIAQAFTGATLHYSLLRTKAGNTLDLTVGYAIGTISDISGNVKAPGGSLTWTW
jgi:hypothetical protein